MNGTLDEIASNQKHSSSSKLFENRQDSLRNLDQTGSISNYGTFQYDGKSLDYRLVLECAYDSEHSTYSTKSFHLNELNWYGDAEIPIDFPYPALLYVSLQDSLVTLLVSVMAITFLLYLAVFIYLLIKNKHGKPTKCHQTYFFYLLYLVPFFDTFNNPLPLCIHV